MGDSLPPPPIAKLTNNKNGLTRLQWNAKSLTSMGHGDELKVFLVNSIAIIDIVCVQETWLYSKKKIQKNLV